MSHTSRTAVITASHMLRHALPATVLEHFSRGAVRRLPWWQRLLVKLRLRKPPRGAAWPMPSNPNGMITFRRHIPCMLAPRGWICTRTAGHEGPCAARPWRGNP